MPALPVARRLRRQGAERLQVVAAAVAVAVAAPVDLGRSRCRWPARSSRAAAGGPLDVPTARIGQRRVIPSAPVRKMLQLADTAKGAA